MSSARQPDMAEADDTPFANGVSLRPRSSKKRTSSASSGEAEDIASSRYSCPEPGCKRTFAELWRLKVHCRASPDVRGSGRERGHGKELSHCPKCMEALQPGKHHIGCVAGRSAPRQAAKRLKSQMRSQSGGDSGLGIGRRHSSGSMPRMSSASSSGTFWNGDAGSPSRGAQQRQPSRFSGKLGFNGQAEASYGDYQSSLQFQTAYAHAWSHLRPESAGMERQASEPLPRFQPFGVAQQGDHGMGHYDPSLLQAAQAAMPQRMESKGSTDLDALQQHARSSTQYGARAFSLPTPGGSGGGGGLSFGGSNMQFGGGLGSGLGGLNGLNGGGLNGNASAAAAAALQATAGFRAPPVSDPLGQLAAQQPWGLPFALQRTVAFGDAAASAHGSFDSRVVSPQPRYPGEGSTLGGGGNGGGGPDNNSLLWGTVKAAAAAVSRPQPMPANGFNQNDAALRFLQGHRALPQTGTGIPASGVDVADLYGNAADLLSKAGMAGLDAARIADQWATPEGPTPAETANTLAGNVTKGPFGDASKWDLLPHRNGGANPKSGNDNGSGDDNITNGSAGGGIEGNNNITKSSGGGCSKAAGKEPGNTVGHNITKPPSPVDAFKLPAEMESGAGFGGLPSAGPQGLSAAAAAGGFGDTASHPFNL